MEFDWPGKAVSIECNERLGIFQGIIKDISADAITIVRAFRNGVPLRKQDAEVTLRSTDIIKISLIPSYNGQSTLTSTVINKPTPVKTPSFNASYADASAAHAAAAQAALGSSSTTTTTTPSTSTTTSNANHTHNCIKRESSKQHQHRSAKDNSSMALAKKLSNMKVENTSALAQFSAQQQQLQLQSKQQMGPNDCRNKNISSPSTPCTNSVAQFFCNLIPPKVEVRMGSAFSVCGNSSSNHNNNSNTNTTIIPMSGATSLFNICADALELGGNCSNGSGLTRTLTGPTSLFNMCADALDNDAMKMANAASKPIDIVGSRSNGHHGNGRSSYANGNGTGSSSNGNGNGNGYSRSRNGGNGTQNGGNAVNNGNSSKSTRQQRKQLRRENSMRQQNRAFATSVDDPLLNEDFDFEGNLALFDKQAIWHVIESGGQKQPESVQPAIEKKYRHDENILEREPPQMRGIEAMFKGSTDFVTDDGLIIPTVPHFVRSKIEITADRCGLKFQRQIDMLARGATEVVITILGGARRLTPKNYHQWPKVVIICEKSANASSANVGATTGRQLASHGIEVVLYLEDNSTIEQMNNEISLFKATGKSIVYSVDDLPTTPDLVILSTNTAHLSAEVTKWLGDNRASIFAIDPPVGGISDVAIKCAILPILPLNGISASNNCGKLYLCNLGIPEKFYRDAGVKYKSPFGHKFVIPIHPKH